MVKDHGFNDTSFEDGSESTGTPETNPKPPGLMKSLSFDTLSGQVTYTVRKYKENSTGYDHDELDNIRYYLNEITRYFDHYKANLDSQLICDAIEVLCLRDSDHKKNQDTITLIAPHLIPWNPQAVETLIENLRTKSSPERSEHITAVTSFLSENLESWKDENNGHVNDNLGRRMRRRKRRSLGFRNHH